MAVAVDFVPAARFRAPVAMAAAVTAMLVAACGGQEERLVPIPGGNTAGIDLSGRWNLEGDVAAMERRIDRAVRQTDGVDERDLVRGIVGRENVARRRPTRRNRDVGGLVHVFLETGERLRISQTDAGLFIAFDRSIVEEYRFGEARMVQTGGAAAQRVSGWEGGSYVIETLDQSGMKLTERYALDPATDRLRREIVLRSAEGETVTILQEFSRA